MKRYLSIALIALFTILVLMFMGQNLELVTVSFLSIHLTLRLGLLVILVYIVGMLTGSVLWSLLLNAAQHVKPKT
ncbi:MAG: DUF1049 domain-containing protein [Betaproteobacteria bacterium]|nr:DUF1049 domain-containing protein [Betaproteobacteria bacterium]